MTATSRALGSDILIERAALGPYRTRLMRVAGDGPPVVLLHGFTDSADTWHRVLRHLSDVGQQAVAVDLPSHGRASRLDTRRPVLPQMASFVSDVLDAHAGSEKAIVVGNSLGGAVTLAVAAVDDRIGKAILLGPAGFAYPRALVKITDARARRPSTAITLTRQIVRGALAMVPDPVFGVAFTEVVRRTAVHNHRAMPRPHRRSYAGHLRRAGSTSLMQMALRLSDEILTMPVDLAALQCEIVAVWGAHDRVCPPRGANVLRHAVPEAKIIVLPGVGHLVQLEAAEITAALVLDRALR